MKTLLSILILFAFSLTAAAQDSGYDTPIFQANPLCPLRITLTANTGTVEYRLRFDQTIVSIGILNPGDTAEMDLSLTDQWYVLLIEWSHSNDYALSSRLVCETDDAPSDETTDEDRQIVLSHLDEFKDLLRDMLAQIAGPIPTQETP